MLKFFHPNDPAMRIRGHPWYFVYLHGWGLESRNTLIANAHNWEWAAPDLFIASGPMPTEEGEYEALFYGTEVVAVIRYMYTRDWLAGRVAEVIYDESDEEGLEAWEHAHQPKEWR